VATYYRTRMKLGGSSSPWLIAAVGVLVTLAVIGSVNAAPTRSVRLVYVRGAGAADCPDEELVRAGVAARLGFEPFDTRSAAEITVAVNRAARSLEAHITLSDRAGRITAERRILSRHSDCAELASAMELAVSIAIDPLAGTRARPAPPVAPDPSASAPDPIAAPARPDVPSVVARTSVPPPAPPSRTPVQPEPPPLVFDGAIGVLGAWGAAPGPNVGMTMEASLRRRSLGVGLEGRVDLPTSTALRVGSIRTSLLTGSLVPCFHFGIAAGCALAIAGVFRSSGHDLVDARQVTLPFIAVGARAALELPLATWFVFRFHGDVIAPLTETVLRVSGQDVWSSPTVSAALGMALVARVQ
jgi:hypothetical protein